MPVRILFNLNPVVGRGGVRYFGYMDDRKDSLVPVTFLTCNGYMSEANVKCCDEAKIMPLICMGRERHHWSWKDRFAEPPPFPENLAPLQVMAHRLAIRESKQCYALRKQIAEPVFSIIKSVMGFRQFSLRRLQQVKGEWNLVTLAWNVRRMFVLTPA